MKELPVPEQSIALMSAVVGDYIDDEQTIADIRAIAAPVVAAELLRLAAIADVLPVGIPMLRNRAEELTRKEGA